MECQANFLPEDHIASVNCNIPELLRKLCLCRMFTVEKGKDEDEDDVIVLNDEEEKKQKKKKKGLKERLQEFLKAKADEMSEGKVDEFLTYLLINLPFNFMIACYTVVGPSLMAKGGPLIRSDLAGVWQMGSPVAVEMVNLPTTFLTVLCVMNTVVSCYLFITDYRADEVLVCTYTLQFFFLSTLNLNIIYLLLCRFLHS